METKKCSICDSGKMIHRKTFDALSQGESDLGVADYYRELWSCAICGHFMNFHSIDLDKIYDGGYWNQTYGEQTTARFKKVMEMPPEQSDNRQRVINLDKFWENHCPNLKKNVIDIGSGLGVFPAAMKASGWHVTALDPDARAVEQVLELGGIDAGITSFFPCELDEGQKFNLVSFNKVLEHVRDPIAMLSHAKEILADGGILYIELPDGTSAFEHSPSRQEFFLEHYAAFSASSMSLLIEKSGFKLISIQRLVEPSGKYTLRAFAC